jgi:ABC-type branched-subunit amino acid transport system substrate-binding protein
VLVLGVAACSSSSSGDGSSPSSAGVGSGRTLPIFVTGTFQAAGINYQDASAAITAKADQLNAAGGINGQQIKIIICDDQHDPNQATACARQAVSDHVLAVLAPSSAAGFGPQVLPVLAAAKIPVIGMPATDPTVWTYANSYPFDPGAPAQYAGVALALKQAGCTDVGSIQLPVPAGATSAKDLADGVTKLGGRLVKNILVGMTESSYSSEVAQLISAGAKCVVPIILPTEQVKLISAIKQSGKQLTIGAVTAAFNQQLLTSLGSAANGIILVGPNYLPTDTSAPAVQDMLAAIKKYTPGTPATDTYATAAWGAATLLFSSILATIKGKITTAAISDALDHASNLTVGTFAPYTFTSPPPNPQLPRLMNTGILTWKVENTTPALVSKNFIDIYKALAGS